MAKSKDDLTPSSDPFFMPEQNPFFLRTRPTEDPHSRQLEGAPDIVLRIGPRHFDARTWTGPGTTVPVFWASLFAPGEIHETGGTTSIEGGGERLELLRPSWKAKSSPRIFRGYEAFSNHLKALGPGSITLDLSPAAAWRRPAFVAAVAQLLDFLEDRSSDPGPLLSGWKECVVWKRTKGRLRLEACSAGDHWPDEVPLLAPHGDHSNLLAPTMGKAPFRQGAWPERLFTSDGARPEDAESRAQDVARAIALHGNASGYTKAMGSAGNLEAVASVRKLWDEFREIAQPLADSAAAFAARHQVYDDTALWQEMLADIGPGLAQLDGWTAKIEAAMRAMGH